MAELIGVLAASAQLAVFSVQAQNCWVSLIEKVRDGPRLVDDLSGQVNDMVDIIRDIQAGPLGKETKKIIERCDKKLEKLAERIGRLRTSRDGIVGRASLALMLATSQGPIAKLMNDIFNVEFPLLQMAHIVKVTETGINQHTQAMRQTDSWTALPPKNHLFVGHADALERIRRRVNYSGLHTRLAIVGLGGAGKSELAVEAAYRLKKDLPNLRVLFVRASSELEFESSYLESAWVTNIINESGRSDPFKGFRGIKSFLDAEASGQWVIIIDGADTKETFLGPRKVFELLPQGANGTLIFTSRNENLAFQLVGSNPDNLISLGPLAQDDAFELLTKVSNDHKSDIAIKMALAKELEYLPLALVQAATFILHAQMDVRSYLDLYCESETQKIDLLEDGSSFKDPVMRTWLISFEQIQKDNALAGHLFSSMACLHYREIPYGLLPIREHSCAKVLSALSLLRAYSMIQIDDEEEILNMHRLVQLSLRHQLKCTHKFTGYAQMAFSTVSKEFPPMFKDKHQLSIGRSLILHAQTVLKDCEDQDVKHMHLTSRVSLYLHVTGNYPSALQYAMLSVERAKAVTGEGSEETLEALSELALVYESLGNYQKCEDITKEVLDKRKEILHDEHPDVLASLNNLGLILEKRGKYQEAEDIHRRALGVKGRVLGSKHDDYLRSLNNLGRALQEQEKYEEAEACFQRVADERQEMFGELHTGRLLSLNNLALVFQQQGKLQEAFTIHLEVFHAREELLGPKHHDTLRSKSNIALNLISRKRYHEAEAKMREVLHDFTETLGKDHLETIAASRNLATILHHQAKLVEAEKLYREVFEARKRLLGDDHPRTISCGRFADEVRVELEAQAQFQIQAVQEEVD